MTLDEETKLVLDRVEERISEDGFTVVEREGHVIAVRDTRGLMFDILVTPVEPVHLVQA
jgi:hypothetical protein